MAEPFVCPADCDKEGVLHLVMPKEQYRAVCKARFHGKRVEVVVRDRKSQRSVDQNALFWALLTPWAHELGYEPTALKNDLLGLLWGYEELVSKLTGEVRLVPMKPFSSKLNTADFSQLIEFMVMKAAETGYVMELPNELKSKKAASR